MTNRPHLVKTEDLTVLPGKRKAAVKARQAIKALVSCVMSVGDSPTHAWDYKKLAIQGPMGPETLALFG